MAKKNRATKNKKAESRTKRSKRNLIIATMAILAMGAVGVGAYMTTASSPNKEAVYPLQTKELLCKSCLPSKRQTRPFIHSSSLSPVNHVLST